MTLVSSPPLQLGQGVLGFRATDLLQLAVHIQIAVPLDLQEIQLLPQGCIPNQLDVKATGDLGWGWGGGAGEDTKTLSEAWPASLFHSQPRRGHLSGRGPIPNLGTLRASPPPQDPSISLLSWGTLHPSRILSPNPT